ncbi:hypothetical protein ACWDZX_23880 [Streptomyces collinus]
MTSPGPGTAKATAPTGVRLPPGAPVDLTAYDARAAPVAPGGKEAALADGVRTGRLLARRRAVARRGRDDPVKCFPHLSYGEHGRRPLRRPDRPDRHGKSAPGDIADRAPWPACREAYETAMEVGAPDPRHPEGDFGVAACRDRLLRET